MGDETSRAGGDGDSGLARKWRSKGAVCLEVGKTKGKAVRSSETRTITSAKASEFCPGATASRLGEKVIYGNRGVAAQSTLEI
jgi:hypothetical protein